MKIDQYQKGEQYYLYYKGVYQCAVTAEMLSDDSKRVFVRDFWGHTRWVLVEDLRPTLRNTEQGK